MEIGQDARAVRPFLASIVRHRLFHFVVVGALLAALAPRERDERVIAIDPARMSEALRAEQAKLGRSLTAEDKARVTAELVDDEVLAREALRLGLATDEPVIRARLAQQMRAQLGEGSATPAAASGPRRRVAVWYAATEREAETVAQSIRTVGLERARGLGARPPIPDGAVWTEKDLASVAGVAAGRAAFATELEQPSSAVASAWGFYVFVPLETLEATPLTAPAKDGADVERFLRRARSEYTVEGVN